MTYYDGWRALVGGIVAAVLGSGATFADANEDRILNQAIEVVKTRQLLTRHELECSSFTYLGTENGVASITVFEKHDRRCGGSPDSNPPRFHMEIDTRLGQVRWDNNDDVEMRPIPQR